MKYFLLLLLSFVYCLFGSAREKRRMILSPNANMANSYLILEQLTKRYCADSLVSWLDYKKQFNVICKVDVEGKVTEIVSYNKNREHPLILNNIIHDVLVNGNIRLFLPMEIIGDVSRKKEISRKKKYYRKMYEKRGFIIIGIPCFHVYFAPSIIEKKEMIDNMTKDRYIEKLLYKCKYSIESF